ncbi:MAG TPA: aminotransferase class IV, partial [Pyrinomonadaceae bacterium]|nr:aminotransferase class IV [Pyrinomonadaceae bacterium]
MGVVDERGGWVWLNGEFTDRDSVSALSSGLFYGKGVFTTVRIVGSEPWLWSRHWERLIGHAEAIRLGMPEFSDDDLAAALHEMIRRRGFSEGRARVTMFESSPSRHWKPDSSRSTSVLINLAKLRPVPTPFHLTVSPYRVNSTSPLVGVKSCNYLENILAAENARSRGHAESIRVNEKGEVTGGCMSNIFWRRGDRIFTPRLRTGCLAGTTRGFVLENLKVEEVFAGPDDIHAADAIYLTSAGIGIVAAESFEGRKLDAGSHPILNLVPASGH